LRGAGFEDLLVLQAAALLNLRLTVRDRALRAPLTPRYVIGCKRILTSSTYYQALARPSTSVHAGGVRAIHSQRVIGADGIAAEVDVIILVTGFEQAGFPVGTWLHDGQGRALRDLQAALAPTVYNAGGCASAYLTSAGRSSFCRPWSTARLSRRLSAFNADDYLITVSPDATQPGARYCPG
jgi:cation diffusion facilitator CzcD-associated flavoprotein CzcO